MVESYPHCLSIRIAFWRLGKVLADTDDSAILQLFGQKLSRPTHCTTSPRIKSISSKTVNENNAKRNAVSHEATNQEEAIGELTLLVLGSGLLTRSADHE